MTWELLSVIPTFPVVHSDLGRKNHDSDHLHIRTCIKVIYPHWNYKIYSFGNPLSIHDTTFTTTYCVIIITILMRSYEVRIQIPGMLIYSSIWTYINLIMRYNIVCKLFACNNLT